MLESQFANAVRAGAAVSSLGVAELEEHQAEPVSEYFPYVRDGVVLVDGAWQPPAGFTRGTMQVGFEKTGREGRGFRGVVLQISAPDRTVVYEAPEHLRRLYTGRLPGGVVVVESLPLIPSAREFQRAVRGSASVTWSGPSKERRSLLAVVFKEETGWRSTGTGWLFVSGHTRGLRNPESFGFVRAGRAGEADLLERIPAINPLRSRRIAVFGLGCLGAPSALEFSRCAVDELRLFDRDWFDPATSARWPLGLAVAGHRKADIVATFIRENYPLTRVVPVSGVLGGTGGEDLEQISQMTDGADLIYDAMAEPGISYFLSELARQKRIPYVGVSGTQGGWGGVVVRIAGEATACWYCFRRAQNDGLIEQAAEDPAGRFQPAGCGDPTFTGTGFDLSVTALLGVRSAVSALLETQSLDFENVLVVDLHSSAGDIIHPALKKYSVKPYDDCPVCRTDAFSGSIN